MEVKNKRWSDEEFSKEREAVLATWPTGKDVNLDEAVEYHKNMPPNRICVNKFEEAKRASVPMVYSFNGTPLLEWQIELLKRLRSEGGADILSTHLDSFTRNGYYAKADEALKESQKAGKPLLNGFPIPIHGVAACRKLVESVDTAIKITSTSTDWRLTQEIGLAGGFTGSSGDPFDSFFLFNKNLPVETTIHNWQYVYRLRGYYEEKGCPILTQTEGTECALCPGSLEDALRILGYLIAAEQGCKHFLCNMVVGCNLAQDLAEAIVLPKLAREYLDRFGYKDTTIYRSTFSWHGRYPRHPAQAFAVLLTGPIVATLSRMQLVATYTVDEAHGIPTAESHIASLRCAKMMVNLLKDQKFDTDNSQVKEEAYYNELEARAIIDKVIELGEGDVAIGMVRAVAAGVVDTPFSTSRYAAKKVMGVRDANGAGRYLDSGNLPFSVEIKDFHRGKIAERAKKQGSEVGYDTLVKDLLSVSEGYLVK